MFRNDASPNSTYAGPPTPERDDAWRRFMLPMGLRVSQDELRRDHQTSVPLPEGGFLGRLGVYHEIHCLVRGPFVNGEPEALGAGRGLSD